MRGRKGRGRDREGEGGWYLRPSTLVTLGERLICNKYSTHSNCPLSTAANSAL